jgi:hypothetical protein
MEKSCNICRTDILGVGRVGFGPYDSVIKGMVSRCGGYDKLEEHDKRFVDAVAWQYHRQFPDVVKSDDVFGIDFGRDDVQRVLDANFGGKYLAVLGHEACSSGWDYQFSLDRIDTAEKALDWQMHLSEKVWFHPYGFIEVLKDLFPEVRGTV